MVKELVKSCIKSVPVKYQLKLYKFSYNLLAVVENISWKRRGEILPPPHQVKQLIIQHYRKAYECRVLVETGTYRGDMIMVQIGNFEKIFSIELSHTLAKEAQDRFAAFEHIEIIQGDSSKELASIVKRLGQRSLFWLDGHYSAGVTARGEKDCPIFEELEQVFSNGELDHIILIDDARDFIGENDYPTITELEKFVVKLRPNYQLKVKNDVIRLLPKE